MRFDFWALVRFLHVGGAILWVGGQLTLSLIVRPVAITHMDEGPRRAALTAMGARFGRIAAWGLFPVLLATGLALSYHRGVEYGAFRIPGYGPILGVKVALAMVSFALAGVHGFAAARSSSGAARAVGIAGALVSILVVLLATVLVL
jgi:uncharacterized membrane protein